MKLKQRDLVEQFEDIVKQEIKNYHDAALAMNVAINTHNERLSLAISEFRQEIARLEGKIHKKDIEKSIESEEIDKAFAELRKKSDLFLASLRSQQLETDKYINSLKEVSNSIKEIPQIRSEFALLKREICDEFKRLRDIFNSAMSHNERQIQDQVQKVRKEFEDKPALIAELKKDLSNKIEVCKTDTDVFLRIVNVVKKE